MRLIVYVNKFAEIIATMKGEEVQPKLDMERAILWPPRPTPAVAVRSQSSKALDSERDDPSSV